MKELIHSAVALIGALIVSVLVYSIGTIYSLGYAIYMTITYKKPLAFFLFWWRQIDGYCAAAAHLLYALAYSLDLGWNVNGEIIEDLVTAKEDTTFSQKNISVSATIGKLEIDGDLNRTGKWFSKALNFAFMQKSHARGAWEFLQTRLRLEKELYNQ